MMSYSRHIRIFKAIFTLHLALIISTSGFAQDDSIAPAMILTGEYLGETIPLRDLPTLTDEDLAIMAEKGLNKILNPTLKNRSFPFSETAMPVGNDPVWQRFMGSNRDTRSPMQNFDGAMTSTLAPTDPNGTIGPNHYMQTINTVYTIYNRAGMVVAGPTNINTLFYGLAGASYNDGDPVVLYDEQAGRWLIAEFSVTGSNDYMLIAVSTTDDPTGTWYKYSFDVADMPDYEKFGIWRDGYYMGTSTYNNMDIYVFERSKMLAGLTPGGVGFDNPWRPGPPNNFNCVPPLDNDGAFAPAGEPGLFIAFNDDAVGGGNDELWIYELDVDWDTLSNSSFSRTQQLAVSPFSSNFGTSQANISQQGTTQKLDAIPMVIMNPPQYRNFGGYETIVCCHTVDVDQTYHAGIRWYELRRVAGGEWTLRQEGTYAPDGHSRWMASIMMNGANEIALGYSVSSSTLYPGIRYCGQSAAENATASGILDISEQVIHGGTQSQMYTFRWGDYSGLQVDAADDETFWFTTQYVTGSSFPQTLQTKIANFQIGTVILTANFAASKINPQTYSAVTLSDASFGNPIEWSWSITPSTFNFLESTSDTSQNPQIQFTEAGNYTISLIITDGTGYDTISKTNYIDVIDCGYLYLPFNEDFSDSVLPACWKNVDNRGLGEVWLFDNPFGWTINTTTGSNGAAMLDSYYYNSGYTQNADLITPLLDLSDYTTVNLFFEHYFPYYTPNGTSAYGKLYYSTDGGASWTLQQSWNNSGNGDDVSINMTTQLAGQSEVRFKWNYTGYGYFWAIDDISITGTGPNTWTGATSADWSTASNWSAGTVPTGTSKVIIPDTAPNWPALAGDLTIGNQCDKMTFYGGSSLTVTGDITLPENKSIVLNGNGEINLAGDWFSAGGYLVPGNGTIKFTGTNPALVTIPSANAITDIQHTEFIKGMTLLSGASAGPSGLNGSADVPIGFIFSYLGTTYTQAHICTNGWLSLNLSGAASNDNTALFSTTAPQTTLAPWFDYLNVDASASLSYKTEGSAPDRVFTVEWKNVLTYRNQATARINFQVKLFETGNVIEFHYGDLAAGSHSTNESASIGIEDATGGSGHFIEATTGSTTNGISNLYSETQWPAVNYRFSPPSPSGNQSFPNLTIDKPNSSLTLDINTSVNGNLNIINGNLISPGSGSGTLSVKANWINNGSFNANDGVVEFCGKQVQNIGGNTLTTFHELIINNPAGISLLNKTIINNTLAMIAGNIDCGSDTLQLGASVSSTGSLDWTSGNIIGPFKRWIAASSSTPIDFPVGTATNNHNSRITFSENTGGAIIARFIPGDPGNNTGFPAIDGSDTINGSDLYSEGSWTLVPDGLTSTNYSLELSGTGFSSAGEPDTSVRILKRPDAGGDWAPDGIHVNGSTPVAKRSGLSGFSRFVLAKPGQLPKIFGNITYYNNANSPITSGVTIKLFQEDSQVGPDYNVSDGTYEFTGLAPGIYELRISSSNSTDGSINTTDAAQVNFWGAVPFEIEKVRFYAGDVTGSSFFINSTDALRIQDNFVNGTALDKGSWAFWRAGETISSNSNPPESYPQVTLGTSNMPVDIYGLCAGDFNRSFIPGAEKSTAETLNLVYTGNKIAGSNYQVDLPIISINPGIIGAISLILHFPEELVKIEDVIMNGTGGILLWNVYNDELRIGWNSMNPLVFNSNEKILTLKLKTTAAFSPENEIRFSLDSSPLNEIADGKYDVLPHAMIGADVLTFNTMASDELPLPDALSLTAYPNPFSGKTTILCSLPGDGRVILQVYDVLGNQVKTLTDKHLSAGKFKVYLSDDDMKPGIYLLKMIFINDNEYEVRLFRIAVAKF